MQSELINIVNEQREPIGVATREEIHKQGYWHEVFHCWLVNNIDNVDYIYLQLRSEKKRDYPNLLDITAAGHLLSDETVEDGVREVNEELGIDISYEELISLGVVDYEVTHGQLIDKEFAHVHVHRFNGKLDEFTLQREEVAGVFMVRFDDFYEMWMSNKNDIDIQGFVLDEQGHRIEMKKNVGREQFVPHNEAFYQEILGRIKEVL